MHWLFFSFSLLGRLQFAHITIIHQGTTLPLNRRAEDQANRFAAVLM